MTQKLFSPIAIGSMQLKNRLVMSPMTTCYANDDQTVSQRLIDYHIERARGGVGLITVEVCTVDSVHQYQPQSICLAEDRFIEGHRRLTDAIHQHGAKCQPQITHTGPESMSGFLHGVPSFGPSVIGGASTGIASRDLALEELDAIKDQYAQAARRAQEAGYDGMELHAAHAYMLLGTFLTPFKNIRDDEYSGNTLEGRSKLLMETIERIRSVVGPDFPITLRISGHERHPNGRDIYETQRLAPQLVAAGIDAFHVSGGHSDKLVSQIVCGPEYPNGYNVPAAEAVKQVVDVPVMVVGRIHDPRYAEQILQAEQADMIVMARPFLADPEIANKAKSGRYDEIRQCISCQNCIDSMLIAPFDGNMNCAVNARTGRESKWTLDKTSTPKRVVIVGGGTAGMEAARVATLRGHKVILLEKNRHLGGSLVFAATVHSDNERFLNYLLKQMRLLNIDCRVGRDVTVASLKALNPDAVIVATGARLELPPLPGRSLPHVISGSTLRGLISGALQEQDATTLPGWQKTGARLAGPFLRRFVTPGMLRESTKLWMPIAKHVAIVGADLAAIELAEFLARRGRRVHLIEGRDDIAPEIGPKRRLEHINRLDALKVPINTSVTVDRITAEGVEIVLSGGQKRIINADTVLLAGDPVADTTLYEALSAEFPDCHAIGDCTGLGLIVKATSDAMRVASAL